MTTESEVPAETAGAAPGEPDDPVDSSAARPREIELKYRLRRVAAGERLLEAGDLAGLTPAGPASELTVEDRYVDTDAGALLRAGFAARLRVTPTGTLISLKSTTPPGRSGTHEREELEGPADSAQPPAEWPPSGARSLLLGLIGETPLVDLVTVRQRRRRVTIADADASVELSLDDVEVLSGEVVVDRWVELEAELLRGDPARLLDLADRLGRERDLFPSGRSKFEAAVRAVRAVRDGRRIVPAAAANNGTSSTAGPTNDDLAPERAAVASDAAAREEPIPVSSPKAPGVRGDDTLAVAGHKILRFHFARMLAREPGTRDGVDIEALHGMRVAARRMRAAWRIFGESYRARETRQLQRSLRRVARSLGAVRDLDVLLEGLEHYRADVSPEERDALAPLAADWSGRRAQAQAELIRGLDSKRHARFLERYRAFVDREELPARKTPATEPHHIRDAAPSRIWTTYERVRAYEGVLRVADVPTLHELRIAAKWLRYTLEFVREPLGRDAAAVITPVVALQDHLGRLHDADVAAALAEGFLAEHVELPEGEATAIRRFIDDRQAAVAELRRTVGGPWRDVAGLAYRRRLGRIVASL